MVTVTGVDLATRAKTQSERGAEYRRRQQLDKASVELPSEGTTTTESDTAAAAADIQGESGSQSGSAREQTFDGASATTDPPRNTNDDLAALFGEAPVAPRPVGDVVDPLLQRATPQNIPQGASRRLGQPEAEAVLATGVPNREGGARTPEERNALYEAELAKQRLPNWQQDAKPALEQQVERAEDGDYEFSTSLNDDFLLDDDFELSFGNEPKVDKNTNDDALNATGTEAGFLKNSGKFADTLTDIVNSNPEISSAFQKLGVLEADGKLAADAGPALLFTAAVEQRLGEVKKVGETKKLAELVDQFHAGGGKDTLNNVTEADLNKQIAFNVLTSTFDRQSLQNSFAPRFSEIFTGQQTQLSPNESTAVAAAVMTAMKNQGLVSETKRVDPNTGRNRSGYEPTDQFQKIWSWGSAR